MAIERYYPYIVDLTHNTCSLHPGVHVIREVATGGIVALVPIPEGELPEGFPWPTDRVLNALCLKWHREQLRLAEEA